VLKLAANVAMPKTMELVTNHVELRTAGARASCRSLLKIVFACVRQSVCQCAVISMAAFVASSGASSPFSLRRRPFTDGSRTLRLAREGDL